MLRKFVISVACVCLAGCGGGGMGAAIEGARVGMNLSKKTSHLRISLDGHTAEENKLKKAATGYSKWKIKDQVSTSPRLRFEITDPDKFGRITMVVVSIHQQFEADYSNQAEFTVVSTSNDPASQMKPDVDYDLGNLPAGFMVLNLTSQQVSRVDLKPGLKYQLSLTVRADHCETRLIEFMTR